jgi:hypothetical protein
MRLIAKGEWLGRAVQIIGAKAGENRSVMVVTADHGMPGEPPCERADSPRQRA